jgi:two-component system, NarL family, response regulator NreC
VTLRALIVDDHTLVADGLSMMLSMIEDMELLGVCPSGEEGVARVAKGDVDIVLMDVNLGRGQSGLEATREIKEASPDTKVLILTMFTDPATVTEAVKAGADGYLSKGASREAVEQAIRDVMAGNQVLDPRVTRGVFGKLSDREPNTLSDRELEVLQEVSRGKSTKEVAEALFLSEETVKTYLKQIFRKLEVRDRTEAVAEAFRRGLVH